jgi:hypothetical protein
MTTAVYSSKIVEHQVPKEEGRNNIVLLPEMRVPSKLGIWMDR